MTATQQILAALIDSPEPLTRYNLAMRHDVLLEPDQISRSLHKLNQRGFIECVGMKEAEHVTKGRKPEAKAYKITQKGIDYMQEQQTNEPDDIDQQLIEAIREREMETVEALIGEFPDVQNDVSGDPIINAIHRLQVGRPAIQNIGTDIRRARELSRVIGDAGPDVSAWLNELADKLEYIA